MVWHNRECLINIRIFSPSLDNREMRSSAADGDLSHPILANNVQYTDLDYVFQVFVTYMSHVHVPLSRLD
jgi:hypothetical protein